MCVACDNHGVVLWLMLISFFQIIKTNTHDTERRRRDDTRREGIMYACPAAAPVVS